MRRAASYESTPIFRVQVLDTILLSPVLRILELTPGTLDIESASSQKAPISTFYG